MNAKLKKECNRAVLKAKIEMAAKVIYTNEDFRDRVTKVLGLVPLTVQKRIWDLMLYEIVCDLEELEQHIVQAYGNSQACKRIDAVQDIRYGMGIDNPVIVPYNFG